MSADDELLDALWEHMQPAWTDESDTLLRVVETDSDWAVIGDSLHENFGSGDPLCPECGALWDSIYFKLWEKGDRGICIDTFYCRDGHVWTRSTGPYPVTTDEDE